MAGYTFTPSGVCSMKISFEIEDGKLHNISFLGGCDGNLKAISKLLEGEEAQRAVDILKGNDCRGRGTSCADQLALAVEQALEEE